jgi:hypothetical protein
MLRDIQAGLYFRIDKVEWDDLKMNERSLILPAHPSHCPSHLIHSLGLLRAKRGTTFCGAKNYRELPYADLIALATKVAYTLFSGGPHE